MAILTAQPIVKTGLNPATALASAAGGGDSFQNTGNEFLRVKNGDVSSKTVTIAQQKACNFGVTGSQHDIVVVVPAGEERWIGPIDPKEYNDTNERAQITYSAVTSVQVEVVAMGRA